MPECPRCGASAGETARFCSACGALIDDASRGTRTRKMVTVLFADVVGFTPLAERLDPESLQQVMGRYFPEMRRVVARHGGTVEKLIGDAMMVVFGVPVLHEDDAVRAARCAIEMRATLEQLNEEIAQRWGERLRTHTGINTGEVVVSSGDPGESTTYGDTVNVAERLQRAAGADEILVGPVTARLLRGCGGLAPAGRLELKGKAAPVEAWRLMGIDGAEHRHVDFKRRLVGRRDELAALRRTFARVLATRSPEMLTITGPAGIGKSRLVEAMLDGIGERAEIVAGRCLAYGEGITYWPLAEIVRRLADRPEEDAVAEAAGGGEEGRTIAHRIARVIGMAPGTVSIDEAHWAARRLFELRAARFPLVVVMDDVHWAEPTLLDLLEHVATAARDVPLLLICLSRPELLERRTGWAGVGGRSTILELGPLPDEDATELLVDLGGDGGIGTADTARLLATAEGNPFFLEQLVAMRAEPGAEAMRTPPTIQALLAARIDALPAVERAVVDRAAVEGRAFHRSAIAELMPPAERGRVDDALRNLARRQLIRPGAGDLPGEAGFRFAHILVRDVAYELLAKSARADLHERYAAWLDLRAGPRFGELVGYHLEQAHRWQAELRPSAIEERLPLANAAAARLREAGTTALQRGDLPAAVNLLDRTASLLPDDAPGRVAVLPELALALVQLGRLPEADRLLGDAIRASRASGDRLAEAHARAAQFFAHIQMDPEAAPMSLSASFKPLHRTFAAAGDDLGLARLYRAQALAHWLLGQAARAEAAWKRGIRHSRLAGDEPGVADCLVWLASVACAGPKPVAEAIADCEAILGQLTADRRSQALSMRPLATLHAMAGDFDLARKLLAESNWIHAKLGVGMHAAAAYEEGYVALLARDYAAAETVLRPSAGQLAEMGEKALFASIAGLLARALAEQGRDKEAWTFIRTVDETAAPEDLSAQMLRRTVRAQLLAREGAAAEADALSAEAVSIGERTDWLVDRADALMVRGEVLRSMGRIGSAADALDEAFELYRRKGNTVSATHAKAAADALPAPLPAPR